MEGLLVDRSVVLFTLSHILDDHVAVLQGILTESHLEEFYVFDFLVDLVVFGAHEFFSEHVLVLGDEGFLGTIQIDQHCSQVDFLVLDSDPHLALLDIEDLPLFCCLFVFV